MRKIELIEMVLDYLNGGDAPDDMKGRFHDEVIKKHVESAFNSLVFQVYMEGKSFADYSVLDSWARNFTVPITVPAGSTSGHAKLPFPPMQLPNNKGILQVAPDNDLTNAFAYRETNANAVFALLESRHTSTRPTFYLEQNTVDADSARVFSHLLRCEKVPAGVTNLAVKMIVPLEVMGDFEHVAIPAGKEDMIVAGTIELLRGKSPADLINDNNPVQ